LRLTIFKTTIAAYFLYADDPAAFDNFFRKIFNKAMREDRLIRNN
jgi:hypothetical protein